MGHRPLHCRISQLVVAALLAASLSACSPAGTSDAGDPTRLQVAVSVPPLADLVDRLGDPRVEVDVILPAGASHATYEPSPAQMIALARARLYVAVGHPDLLLEERHVEPFLDRHPEIRRLALADGATLLPSPRVSGAHHEAGHQHASGDPHLWLSPRLMAATGRKVSAALAELDPEGRELYAKKLQRFEQEVKELDKTLRAVLADLEGGEILVFHPAWGYLAHDYGFVQVAVEQEGKEPGPAGLAALIQQARQHRTRIIFVQLGFSQRSARVIAQEIGARVVSLDPLAADWMENLERAARAFRESLEASSDEEPGAAGEASVQRRGDGDG